MLNALPSTLSSVRIKAGAMQTTWTGVGPVHIDSCTSNLGKVECYTQ